jgi:leucyl aminopeptidase
MRVELKKGKVESFNTECLLLLHFESDRDLLPITERVDRSMNGLIRRYIEEGDFKGELHEMSIIPTLGLIPAKRVVLAGGGKRDEWSIECIRGLVGKAARLLRDKNVKEMTIPINFSAKPSQGAISNKEIAQAITEGAFLGLYQFLVYRTTERDKIKEFDKVIVLYDNEGERNDSERGLWAGEIISKAVCMARDLVTEPPNVATPSYLAKRAEEIASELDLKLDVLEREKMQDLGMGALLAVAKGSQEPPKLIVIEYMPKKEGVDTIAIVGKAITFDSGGISLKPAKDMERMKEDMAGGAAVLGVIEATARLGLNVRVIGLIPATENLPGGRAYRPGDIITSLSGHTIEIVSTDAEGRLILADALTYALRYKPDGIIDLATLTGACIVALGDEVIGIMGNHDGFIERIKMASEVTGERCWQLPIWKQYDEYLKSDVADIKNAGGRSAGAIQGGIFLKRFVGNTPWVHLDIAGPCWTDKDRPYTPKGATGAPVRLIVQMLRDWTPGCLKEKA